MNKYLIELFLDAIKKYHFTAELFFPSDNSVTVLLDGLDYRKVLDDVRSVAELMYEKSALSNYLIFKNGFTLCSSNISTHEHNGIFKKAALKCGFQVQNCEIKRNVKIWRNK